MRLLYFAAQNHSRPMFFVLGTDTTSSAKQRVLAADTGVITTTSNFATSPRKLLHTMIVLGIILLIAGFLLKISILWTIGIIILIVGIVLTVMGSMGRAVGGRRTYY